MVHVITGSHGSFSQIYWNGWQVCTTEMRSEKGLAGWLIFEDSVFLVFCRSPEIPQWRRLDPRKLKKISTAFYMLLDDILKVMILMYD